MEEKKYKKFNLISGGYIGFENDVVVDNFKDQTLSLELQTVQVILKLGRVI